MSFMSPLYDPYCLLQVLGSGLWASTATAEGMKSRAGVFAAASEYTTLPPGY